MIVVGHAKVIGEPTHSRVHSPRDSQMCGITPGSRGDMRPVQRCSSLGIVALLSLTIVPAAQALIIKWGSTKAASLCSRDDALTIVNHPLIIQLGTGDLPMGSFRRLLLARSALLEAAGESIVAACSELTKAKDPKARDAATSLEALISQEVRQASDDATEWLAAAERAGKTIELPAEQGAAGVSCYGCGGNHYNVDCPDDLSPSRDALTLSSHMRAARGALSQLGAAAPIFRCIGWSHATMASTSPEMNGGRAFQGWTSSHALRWTAISEALEHAFDCGVTCLDAGEVFLSVGGALSDLEVAVARREAQTSFALLYAAIDSEAATAGLQSVSATMSVQEAREAIALVEPGFNGDKHRVFMDEVLGAKGAEKPSEAAASSSTAAAERRLKAAAAYMEAKKKVKGEE
jgi:hypothetical protein